MNLIIGVVLLCVLNCFLANLNANYLHIWQFLLNGDTYCANATSKIQNHITIHDCLDDLRVKNFAHIDVDLEEGCGRYLEDMIENPLLVVRVSVYNFRLVCWDAISFSIVAQEAKTRKTDE